jgi:hypothetical protein
MLCPSFASSPEPIPGLSEKNAKKPPDRPPKNALAKFRENEDLGTFSFLFRGMIRSVLSALYADELAAICSVIESDPELSLFAVLAGTTGTRVIARNSNKETNILFLSTFIFSLFYAQGNKISSKNHACNKGSLN